MRLFKIHSNRIHNTLNGLALLLIISISITGCAVKSNPTSKIKYKTFAMVDSTVSAKVIEYSNKMNQPDTAFRIIQLDIRPELNHELNNRGLKMNNQHPDYLLSYSAVLTKDNSNRNGNQQSISLSGYNGSGAIPKSDKTTQLNISHLTLTIKLIDSNNHVVLQSISKENDLDDLNNLVRTIEKNIHNMLNKVKCLN